MLTIIVFLILLFFQTQQALIGYHLIPESKLQFLTKNDPAFSLTYDKVNELLWQHCGLKIQGITSVSYKIVEGIKYNMIVHTIYGPLNVVGITKFWQKFVNITQMKLMSVENEQNSFNSTLKNGNQNEKLENFTKILPLNSNSKVLQVNNWDDNQESQKNLVQSIKYQFPLLRSECVHMQQQLAQLEGSQVDFAQNNTKQGTQLVNKTSQKQDQLIVKMADLVSSSQPHDSLIQSIINVHNPIIVLTGNPIIILADNSVNQARTVQIASDLVTRPNEKQTPIDKQKTLNI